MNRRLLFILLVCFISCSKETDYNQRTAYYQNISPFFSSDSTISCLTYNIRQGFKTTQDPWNKDHTGADLAQIQQIAALIRQLNPLPDVIALQEVPRNRYNAVIKNFLERLAEELQLNYAFGAHGYNDPYGIYPVEGEWGNAILSKFEITNIHNHEIEYRSKWEKRSLFDVSLKMNDSTTIHAISIHYLPSPEAIPNTTEYIATLNNPVILMGDFNYSAPISSFEQIGLQDVDSTAMLHHIDRIFVSKTNFDIQEIGSIPDSLFISDHLPNFARLKFKH